MPAAAGLSLLGWPWPLGILWGIATVAVARLAWWGMITVTLRSGGGGVAAGLASVGRHLLLSLLALAGVLAGLPVLAVGLGLLLPSVGRWVWVVRVARSSG